MPELWWLPLAPPCNQDLHREAHTKARGICPQHPLASPSLQPTLTVKLFAGCWVWERGLYPLHGHSSFRDALNHRHVVRKRMRRSVLEPKSNPHGIQADFPQIMRWYQPRQFGPKAPSDFQLQRTEHGCISSRGKAEKSPTPVIRKGYAQGVHVEEGEQVPLKWAHALVHKGQT